MRFVKGAPFTAVADVAAAIAKGETVFVMDAPNPPATMTRWSPAKLAAGVQFGHLRRAIPTTKKKARTWP